MPHPSAPPLALAAALALSAPAAQAGELYAVSQVFDEVFVIDTTTGLATLVNGVPPADNVTGIAFDETGELFGLDGFWSDSRFWSLDEDAGAATFIGWTGMDDLDGALAYDPGTGLFYGARTFGGGVLHELVTIDPATGVATVVGPLTGDVPNPGTFAGMTFLPDGTLLGYHALNTGEAYLFSIDTTTQVSTLVGFVGIVNSIFGGLAYDPDTDTLYMSAAADLWTIDYTTGVGTLIGSHGFPPGDDLITGLAVLPDPEQPCMIGLDLTSTLWDIDPLTGTGTNPRFLGESKFGGLALSASGELFGIRAAPIPELYSIDQASGAATLIGPLEILHNEGGLDFQPSTGELFGVGGVSDLFQIDTTTGEATLVGPLLDEFGDPIDPSAMAFDDAGALFVLKAACSPPEIYQVDPSDGSVLDRVPLPGLPLAFFGGMDFDDSTGLLHLTYGDVLYRANPYTGATVFVGPTPALMSALEIAAPCEPPPPQPMTPRRITGGTGGWGG